MCNCPHQAGQLASSLCSWEQPQRFANISLYTRTTHVHAMCTRTRMYTYTIFNIDLSSLETAQTRTMLQYRYKNSHGSPAIFLIFNLILRCSNANLLAATAVFNNRTSWYFTFFSWLTWRQAAPIDVFFLRKLVPVFERS